MQSTAYGRVKPWFLERSLRLKFDTSPDAVQQQIKQAHEQTLLQWSERIPTASRLDEIPYRMRYRMPNRIEHRKSNAILSSGVDNIQGERV